MPKLGLTMQNGTILEWMSKEGDTVEKGKPLFSIDTQKVTVDVESPASGVLRKILASAGSTVAVGGLVAFISEINEPLPELDRLIEEATKPFIQPGEPENVVSPTEIKRSDRVRVPAAPAVRKLAREYNIDLSQVTGTGTGGRIQREDVAKAIESSKAGLSHGPSVARIVSLTSTRLTIIQRLSESYAKALHARLEVDIDFSELIKFRERFSQQAAKSVPSFTDLLVRAVALALREHELLNSTLEGDHIKIFRDINIGIAVATEGGLVVPVVRKADQKKLDEISQETRDLIDKSRKRKLTFEDLTDGTFTITNLGMYAIDSFDPIINPPEAAILAVGRIAEKPVAINGQVSIRSMASLTLTFDHRIVDGAQASQFMKTLHGIIAKPDVLGS
jgi:pyruvate dehydrogenase E2 component (dihydrolipoamide acetyltransferase)